MEYKEIAKHVSTNGLKEAIILKSDAHYRVSVKNEGGSYFFTDFPSEDRAQEFAKHWVS